MKFLFRIPGAAIALALMLLAMPAVSSTPADDDEFDWFDEDFEALTRDVNEGQLRFLLEPPQKPVHHHHNEIVLNADSLREGWVQMTQCHYGIGNVGRAQILFRKGGIRNLRVTEMENIDEAWVEGDSVQLKIYEKDSTLCIEAESQALTANDDGSYRLTNGPFMRRFLDGYYPMRVTMKVVFADSELGFASISPQHQPGFTVDQTPGSVSFDAWFEGRLKTEIELSPINPPLVSCGFVYREAVTNCYKLLPH